MCASGRTLYSRLGRCRSRRERLDLGTGKPSNFALKQRDRQSLAIQERCEDGLGAAPKITACAKAVAAVMAENPVWTMKTDPNWIADHIRELFDQREVDGKTEYRPKPEWVHPT